ncbi:MAG: ribonuclease H-like YkuK family protein [Candidatus Doudnabacteria bacterium]|nr:ribonuclease H-like YkuK family protein [Candidatus Doudnabacteria bacterium]
MSSSINFLKFNNPTLGEMVFAQVVKEVLNFMKADMASRYKVMIGSDSNGNGILDIVSVVAIHRIGNGGRYFWCRSAQKNIHNLRQKIYAEVQASLDLTVLFLPAFRDALRKQESITEIPFDFQIHVDVGMQGETKDLVREITGMVRGYGYEVFIKPQAAAATTVADRHVK